MIPLERFSSIVSHPIYLQIGAVKARADKFAQYAEKNVLIVTGRSSAKTNSSLSDVTAVLASHRCTVFLFNEVEPNPSIETINRCIGSHASKDIVLVIGLGGGSAMDASKAIAYGLNSPDYLSATNTLAARDVVCISTASGTGSETTQYAILTDHAQKTKVGLPRGKFANFSLIDPSYQITLPVSQTISMFCDTMCHALEAVTKEASNDLVVEATCTALQILGQCWTDFLSPFICRGGGGSDLLRSTDFRTKMALSTVYAGISIVKAGTSLPHGLGYKLTYDLHVSHGKACAVFIVAFLRMYVLHGGAKADDLVHRCLAAFGLQGSCAAELLSSLDQMLCTLMSNDGTGLVCVDQGLHDVYIQDMLISTGRIKGYPFNATHDDLRVMLAESLSRK